MYAKLILSTLLMAGLNAAAADFSKTFTGTATYGNGTDSKTYQDQITITTHTDANGNFLPNFETTEVLNGDTAVTTLTNPTMLKDGSGYTFDMTATMNGQPVGDLGQCFQANGTPGNWTSFSFDHCAIINASDEYQVGTGTVTTDNSGVMTLTRTEQVVDDSGNVLETFDSTTTYTPAP